MSIDLGNRLGDLDHPFLKIAHYGGYLEVGNIEMMQVAVEHEKLTLHSVWLAGSLRK